MAIPVRASRVQSNIRRVNNFLISASSSRNLPVAYKQPFSTDSEYQAQVVSTFSSTAESLKSSVPTTRLGTFSSLDHPARGDCGISRHPYWRSIDIWKDVTEKQFLSYSWQVSGHAAVCQRK